MKCCFIYLNNGHTDPTSTTKIKVHEFNVFLTTTTTTTKYHLIIHSIVRLKLPLMQYTKSPNQFCRPELKS